MKKVILVIIIAIMMIGCKEKKPTEVQIKEFKSATEQLRDYAQLREESLPDTKDWQYLGEAKFVVTAMPYQKDFYTVEVSLRSIQPAVADIRAISMVFEMFGNMTILPFVTNGKPNVVNPLLTQAILVNGGGMFANQIGRQVRFSWFALAPFNVLSTSDRMLFTFVVKLGSPQNPTDPARLEWVLTEPWYNEISPTGRENMIMDYQNYTFNMEEQNNEL